MIRRLLRWTLGLFYFAAGYFHLAAPASFLRIMPSWVPYPEQVVIWTGVAELAGAIALIQPFSPPLRKVGAIGLALYALMVFPANINHFIIDMAHDGSGGNGGALGLAYHVPRMFAQPLIIWLSLWVGGVTRWPFANRADRRRSR